MYGAFVVGITYSKMRRVVPFFERFCASKYISTYTYKHHVVQNWYNSMNPTISNSNSKCTILYTWQNFVGYKYPQILKSESKLH